MKNLTDFENEHVLARIISDRNLMIISLNERNQSQATRIEELEKKVAEYEKNTNVTPITKDS